MKGHPKSFCLDADSVKKVTAEDDEKEQPLTSVFKSMKLASPKPPLLQQREEDNKAFIRERRRQSAAAALASSDTLLSVSTDSKEIMAQLFQPGTSNSKPEDDEYVAIAATPKKSVTPHHHVMPGTLIPPTPDTSFKSDSGSPRNMESPPKEIGAAPTSEDSASTVTVRRRQPLSRSMSSMERDSFMSNLAKQAAATIYVVPKVDAQGLQTQAAGLKYSTHLIINEDDPQALLILGRDESSVKALAQQIDEENRNAALNKNNRRTTTGTSNLKAVAGAAVVGVVGTWAGLAFT